MTVLLGVRVICAFPLGGVSNSLFVGRLVSPVRCGWSDRSVVAGCGDPRLFLYLVSPETHPGRSRADVHRVGSLRCGAHGRLRDRYPCPTLPAVSSVGIVGTLRLVRVCGATRVSWVALRRALASSVSVRVAPPRVLCYAFSSCCASLRLADSGPFKFWTCRVVVCRVPIRVRIRFGTSWSFYAVYVSSLVPASSVLPFPRPRTPSPRGGGLAI